MRLKAYHAVSRWLLAAALLAILTSLPPAHAQTFDPGAFPSKPVRMVLGFPPGGLNDILGRALAQQLQKQFGQPVISENRPGANGIIAASSFSNVAPDGYNLLLVFNGMMVHNRYLYAKLAYEPRDFVPISLITEFPQFVAVRRGSPFKTVGDLIDYGKANPGKLNYGSVGIGNALHLSAEMFNSIAGIRAEHIPYPGGAQVIADLVAGRVDYLLIPGLFPGTQAQTRLLALIERKRSPLEPNVPTVVEAGLPEFDVNSWLGVVGPKGMTPDLVRRINAEINTAVAAPETVERFRKMGVLPKGGTPAQFSQLIESHDRLWAPLIRKLGLRLD